MTWFSLQELGRIKREQILLEREQTELLKEILRILKKRKV